MGGEISQLLGLVAQKGKTLNSGGIYCWDLYPKNSGSKSPQNNDSVFIPLLFIFSSLLITQRFSLSHSFFSIFFFSSYQIWLNLFSVFRFQVRFSFSFFFLCFSHMHTPLFLTLSLLKSGYCADCIVSLSPLIFSILYIQICHNLSLFSVLNHIQIFQVRAIS